MRPSRAGATPSAASREFSAETISALLQALRARAERHPESPGLIASWPGVPEDRMPAACAELRRQGHAVRPVSIYKSGAKPRRGWALGGTAYRADETDDPLAALLGESNAPVRDSPSRRPGP